MANNVLPLPAQLPGPTPNEIETPNGSAPITVVVPGTCGELVQGWYAPWNEAVLVSCPIARYSRVTVWLKSGPHIEAHGTHRKVQQAARLLLDETGRPDLGARIQIQSQLPVGRGMASSTADIVGTMVGLLVALEQKTDPIRLPRLACQIEPSDSTMFNQLALLAYRGSGRFKMLGSVPALTCLILDPGQSVDTLSYNAQLNIAAVRKLASTTQTALDLLIQGLNSNDFATIGAAATLSATAYQSVNYSSLVPLAQQWAKTTGAVGIVRAHSGSVVGLLYPPDTPLEDATRQISLQFTGELIQTALTGSGYQIFDKAAALC